VSGKRSRLKGVSRDTKKRLPGRRALEKKIMKGAKEGGGN